MSADIFKQAKETEACLSAWQVSLIAAGDEIHPAASTEHLKNCVTCAARVQRESEQVQNALHEPIPLVLFRRPQAPRATKPQRRHAVGWMWAAVGPAVAAGIAAVLISVMAQDETLPQNRVKGGAASLTATVQREGGIVLDDRPLEGMRLLRNGDQLRLRLAGDVGTWVQVQGLEDGHWTTYFQGPPPADRWLPFGIELTDQGDTRLRLISCATIPRDPEHLDVSKCSEHVFDL